MSVLLILRQAQDDSVGRFRMTVCW